MAYLKARRGDRERYDITLAAADGSALDLDTLDEIWFTIKAHLRDGDSGAAVQKTLTGGGITKTVAASGIAQIQLDPADTEDFPNVRLSYPFDVQVLDNTGEIATPIRGRITVSPDVTLTRTL